MPKSRFSQSGILPSSELGSSSPLVRIAPAKPIVTTKQQPDRMCLLTEQFAYQAGASAEPANELLLVRFAPLCAKCACHAGLVLPQKGAVSS